MSKQKKARKKREERTRRLSISSVRRDPPDMRKLGQALLSLAAAELERQAQEQGTTAHSDENQTDGPMPEGGGHGERSG